MIELIKNIRPASMSNSVHCRFHEEVLAVVSDNDLLRRRMSSLLEAYEKAVSNRRVDPDEYLRMRPTDELCEADARRTGFFRSARGLVLTSARCADAATVASCRKLAQLMDAHCPAEESTVEERTERLRAFLKRVKEDCTEDVERVNIGWVIEELKKADEEVAAMVEKWRQAAHEKMKFRIARIRMATDEAYKKLTAMINARILIRSAEEVSQYRAIACSVNSVVERYRACEACEAPAAKNPPAKKATTGRVRS